MTAIDYDAVAMRDIRLLDIGRVLEYLRSRGWSESLVAGQKAGRGLVHVFNRSEPDNNLIQLRIPTTQKLADYDDVLWRSILTLSKFENNSPQDVLSNLLYYSDDLIMIREDTPDSKNGSVSLERASGMLSGIKKTILSVAHIEIHPQWHYPRLDRADAELLLNRCRFGQTRRGSYVMTIACPLNAVPEGANPQQESLFTPSFARRVTTRLMSSVRTVVDAAVREDITPLVQSPESIALSANLCDALVELTPVEASGKLELSCCWAKKRPLDNEAEAPTTVTLRQEITPFIESVGQYLRAKQFSEVKQDFFGRIDTLNGRPNADGKVSGTVSGRMTDPNNETIRVRIDLDVEQYKEALEAHGEGKIVMITGVLRRSASSGLRIEDHNGLQVISRSK